MICGECNVISLYFMCYSVNGSVCALCLTVFVNCLMKQFTIYLCVVVILLLNVMEVFRVGDGVLLDRLCMVFQRMCVCCACDPSVYIDVPCISCVCVCQTLYLCCSCCFAYYVVG